MNFTVLEDVEFIKNTGEHDGCVTKKVYKQKKGKERREKTTDKCTSESS